MAAPSHSPSEQPEDFKPYVPASESPAEFTAKAIILGAVFGIIFGAATVYLALKAGLTVSASIPIAVLSIAVFKKLGKSTILENNIVQTIGSAGESIAAGVVFTLPALLFLADGEHFFRYLQIATLAAVGGILGILFMVPLRRSLIVKEHGNLPYPEGTACADVLIVGEKGGNLAKRVFAGVYTAIVYKLFMSILGLWKDVPTLATGPQVAISRTRPSTPRSRPSISASATSSARASPPRCSRAACSSWLVLIPLISLFVPEAAAHRRSARARRSPTRGSPRTREAEQIYRAYIRYIGAGAVCCAGVMTLVRSLPTIISSFRDSMRDLRGGAAAAERASAPSAICRSPSSSAARSRSSSSSRFCPTCPATSAARCSWRCSSSSSASSSSPSRRASSASSASSSNPISGMTIATLMATCLIFVVDEVDERHAPVDGAHGRRHRVHRRRPTPAPPRRISRPATSSAPRRIKQQMGLIIGVLVSTLVIGGTILLLDHSVPGELHGIGSARMPRRRAR